MKLPERFMALFQTTPPPTLRGRVDPYEPGLTSRAEAKKREAEAKKIGEYFWKTAKAKNRPGMFVHRAKTGTWQDYKDARVKAQDDDAGTASS